MYNINIALQFAKGNLQLPAVCTLIIGLFSTLTGQNTDQLIDLTRYHMVPGQETAFIAENANSDRVFNTPCYVYVYSDHTFEFSTPFGMEKTAALLKPLPNHFQGQANLAKAISKQENRTVHYQASLSYDGLVERLPAKMSGETYLEVVTYQAQSSYSTEMMEKFRELPELMQEMSSPVAFDCYTYKGEDETIFFELVYPARDPDDLAERRAIQEATLTKSVQKWRRETQLLADQLSKVTGHYVYELSSELDQPH